MDRYDEPKYVPHLFKKFHMAQGTDAESGTARRGTNPDDVAKQGAKSNKKGDDGGMNASHGKSMIHRPKPIDATPSAQDVPTSISRDFPSAHEIYISRDMYQGQ
ncbi:unnamed protein product [Urochloa humidicola]